MDANTNDDNQFEEECVICLEELKDDELWGRCSPCDHAFHKRCWWDWENAHNERAAKARRRGDDVSNYGVGPKCCLCNTVVKQFVDGKGEPAHNPEPYVAEDDGEENKSFFDFFFRGGRRGRNDGGEGENEDGGDNGPVNQNDMNGAMEFLQRMAQQGGSVMGMDPAVLLDQMRFGGGFGGPPFPGMAGFPGASNNSNNSNNNNSNSDSGNGINLGRMFQEWGAGGGMPFGAPSRSGSNVNNAQETTSFNKIRSGTPIAIQDLVNSSHSHLNGQRGTVQQFDPQAGRYVIKVDSTNVTVSLKPENIVQTLKVKILGLISQPQFNGQEGTIVSYNKERNRYAVRVALPSETKEISIKAANIRIPDLAKVRLEGLESQPQWNGRYGEFRCFLMLISFTAISLTFVVILLRNYSEMGRWQVSSATVQHVLCTC